MGHRPLVAVLLALTAPSGFACAAADASPDGPLSPPPVVAPPSSPVPDVIVLGAGGKVVATRGGFIGEPVDAIVGMDDHTIVAVEDGSLTWRAGAGGAVTA